MTTRISSPVFVGRAEELHRLQTVLDGAMAGTVGTVLAGGEAGRRQDTSAGGIPRGRRCPPDCAFWKADASTWETVRAHTTPSSPPSGRG